METHPLLQMTQQDWIDLEDPLSMSEDRLESILRKTEKIDQHPHWFEGGPCRCKACKNK